MIDIERLEEIAILRMNRGKANAFDIELLAAVRDALTSLLASDARAAVLTGTGRAFGAGVDLAAIAAGGPAYIRRFLPLLSEVIELAVTFPKPLIAAVNGHAIAGGAIVMMACDQRLLTRDSARVGLTEIQVGVRFPAWALEIARFTTPPQHFSTLIERGLTYLPQEALERGLVDELVDADQLLPRACQVAVEMGRIPAKTFAVTKLAVRRPMIEAARAQAALTDAEVIDDWCSPETTSAIARFAAGLKSRG